MKRTIALMAAFAAVSALFALPASAAEFKAGDIAVGGPWARASAGKAANGAAYITQIVNAGLEVDRLVGAATPVAKTAELHVSKMEDGVMKMMPLKAIEVAPGEPTVMKPGGMHIMLMGLKDILKMGDMFPMTLTFEKAGKIEIQVMVLNPGSMHGGMDHGPMDHGPMDHGPMDHGPMDHGPMDHMEKSGANPCAPKGGKKP